MKIVCGREAQRALIPAGWLAKDRMDRINYLCSMSQSDFVATARGFWDPGFHLVTVDSVEQHDMQCGTEIGMRVAEARARGDSVVIILPVGPMGMYKYAIKYWDANKTDLNDVYGFNMDSWSDRNGNSVNMGESFEDAMQRILYAPLDGRISLDRQNFATRNNLPLYAAKIKAIKQAAHTKGKKCIIILVHGIGQACHIAFWEPHAAALYPNLAMWKRMPYKLGMPLCAMTLEQNAITSAFSDVFSIPAYANTIGPGIYMQADYFIGGCDGVLMQTPGEGFSMSWQAQAVRMSLGWSKDDPWVPSSWLPQHKPGKLFVVESLLRSPKDALSH